MTRLAMLSTLPAKPMGLLDRGAARRRSCRPSAEASIVWISTITRMYVHGRVKDAVLGASTTVQTRAPLTTVGLRFTTVSWMRRRLTLSGSKPLLSFNR